MFSIHAFIRNEDTTKQVPLVFVLMSAKRIPDYVAVFQEILDLIPNPRVREVMVDFEEALWRTVADILPDVTIKGCAFHWAQAVYRKVQDLGLAVQYKRDIGTHDYIRKILALPYLPPEFVEDQFSRIKAVASTNKLQDLVAYIRRTWIENTLWAPASWSCFMASVRTNNDVEGWHRRFNLRANEAGVAFYVLIPMLHAEARLLPLQVRLVSEKKLARYQRKTYRELQRRLLEYWEDFNEERVTIGRLL